MPLLIAVDLGAHAVKVTTYRSAGRRVELEDRFSYPVPQGGMVPPLTTRLAALEALLDENPGWAGGTATIGLVLPGSNASLRPMELPFTDKAQVEKTLPFAIEAEVPYDLEDMVLGWRATRLADKSRVMAVLTRKDLLASYLTALSERGMDPARVAVDGELLGIYGGMGTCAVVDVGHTHTVVTVVVEGEVRASRAINVGGWNFTKAIQEALSCEWGHAEALKHGQIVDDDITESSHGRRSGYATLTPPAKAAMDGAIGQLLAEVRSTLIRFEDTLGLEVDEVRLCGGGARIPELWQYLAQDLGVEVSRCEDPDGEAISGPMAVSHALGRQLAGLGDTEPVDLRIGEFAFKGGVNTMRAVLTYGTAGAVFFAVAAVAIFAVRYVQLYMESTEVNDRIVTIVTETFPEVKPEMVDSGSKAVAIMAEFTGDTVGRSDALPPPVQGKPPTVDRLYAFTNALPKHEEVGIQMSSIEFLHDLITFEGITDGFAESAKLEEALQSHPTFKRANKDSESRTSKGQVKVKFSIPLGEIEKKEEAG